ncbi:uncharacterized protein TM35_000072350 [Trypanosoma theileri]|uniref:Uncharacterized protein n=1 Tax=Trypanosoma theileri TaxID=67003 RepID=A0A1X0P1U4_9TRYP|nr:uncharacterized protein TM35_000072350 [Trypanosoma theileri]ORC90811.1 hypothetical protein TM35_000072350 [Trypanosoma theileri]
MAKLNNSRNTELTSSKGSKTPTKNESTPSKLVNKSPESFENPMSSNCDERILSNSDCDSSSSDMVVHISTMIRHHCLNTRSPSNTRSSSGTPALSTRRRSYSISDEKTLFPPRHMMVERQCEPGNKRPDWNSNRRYVDESPKEKLPRIRIKSPNKYEFLHRGKSVTQFSRKPTGVERQVVSWLTESPIKNVRGKKISKKNNENILQALKQINFKEAFSKFKSGDTENPFLRNADVLFKVFSMRTDSITEEMLYDHFLMFTPTGVAPYEAFDFLKDSCDGKKELSFEDFLCYGDKLRERLCAFEDFTSLTDQDKINTILTRVLNDGVRPTEMKKARNMLLKYAEDQQNGQVNSACKSMRAYELSFLVDMKKKNGTTKGNRYSSHLGGNGRFNNTPKRNPSSDGRPSSHVGNGENAYYNNNNNKKGNMNGQRCGSALLYDFSVGAENNNNNNNNNNKSSLGK